MRTSSGSVTMLRGSQELHETRVRCLVNNALLITTIFIGSDTGTVLCDLLGKSTHSTLGIIQALRESTALVCVCPLAAPGVTHSKSDRETDKF